MPVLRAKIGGVWVDVGTEGPPGPPGPIGPDEVIVSNVQPTAPEVDVWYNPDAVPVELNTANPRNAIGVVAMGSVITGTPTLAANTPTTVASALSVPTFVGRRYRISFFARAIAPSGSGNIYMRMILLLGGAQYSTGHPLKFATAGWYEPINYQWLFDGDGTTKVFALQLQPEPLATIFYNADTPALGYFYCEDIGPNSAPALPVPATPEPWIPVTLINGWVPDAAGVAVPSIRKIGDIVYTRGSCYKVGTSPTGAVFVYPAGFRPPHTLRFGATAHRNGVGGVVMSRSDANLNGNWACSEWASAITDPCIYLNDTPPFSVTA
jgi:hypothetical protein